MVNIKLVIIPSRIKKTGECSVDIQVSKDRKLLWIPTGVSVLPNHFENGHVKGGKAGDQSAVAKNIRISEKFNEYQRKLLLNDEELEKLSLTEIKEFLVGGKKIVNTNFFDFAENQLNDLKSQGKVGSARHFKFSIEKIKEFHNKPKLEFSEINNHFLEKFDQHAIESGLKRNTIATVFRDIRSIFNDAIDEFNDNVSQPVILNYPFRKFKIKTETTRNRNLSIEIIRKIKDYKAITQREEVTRDVFMLQFMMFGINMKDLFNLKHSNIVDGRLQFNRAKTGRFYNIKIEPESQRIINKYKGEKYLLWFADYSITERSKDERKHTRNTDFQYKDHDSFAKMINENLEKIQESLKLKLPADITSYFARHSFASIMREIGISRDDISLCLGHVAPEQSMKVTGIYINEDFGRADKANRLLLDHLFAEPKKETEKVEAKVINLAS